MLSVFRRAELRIESAATAVSLASDAIWLDLVDPTVEERQLVERHLGLQLPTRDEMRETEASARAYEEGEALFLTAMVLVNADEPPPATTEITFVLTPTCLVTLRHASPQPFRSLDIRLERHGNGLTSPLGVLFWLTEQIVGRLADVLERAAVDVDMLSREIFSQTSDGRPNLIEAMARIGRNGDTASKVRESLITLQRTQLAIGVSSRVTAGNTKEMRARAKVISRDLRSLLDDTTFLSQKAGFLLDATVGLISIEQNATIKIFSVVAVVFLPPTLIASIYGMNFKIMPELDWMLGYPMALLMMVASAIMPYWLFRRKGWL